MFIQSKNMFIYIVLNLLPRQPLFLISIQIWMLIVYTVLVLRRYRRTTVLGLSDVPLIFILLRCSGKAYNEQINIYKK